MVTEDRTGKELTKEEFMQWYKREMPFRAKLIALIAKLFTLGVTLLWFLLRLQRCMHYYDGQ